MSRHTSKRQLTGFGELLDWRPLEFADTVPNVFCCTLCGVLPAFPKRLTPCCHVFCQKCFEKLAEREHRCPLDQTAFAEDAVETLDSAHGGVNRLRARCPNTSSGCPFVGALPELKEHVAGRCDHNEVQCPRCGATVLQRTALNHYLEDCGGKGKVATPVTSETSSVASAERSEEDASRKSNRRSKSAKKLDKAKRSVGVSGGARKSTSVENAAAADKPQIVAAIRSLLQDSHGGSIRSATRNASRTSSIETSLIKSDRKGVASTKPDLQSSKSTTAKASKSAGGVQETDKESSGQLLDEVDSMLTKAMETASADVSAAATPATAEEEASKSSSSSSSSSKKSASSSSSPRHRGRKHDSSKKAKGVARVGASSPPGFACCYITGIVGAESRIACGEELVLRSDSSQLADCTFRVHARLRRDAEGSVLVCFTLCLCGGTWHQVADWALANKVSLLLVHPWDQALNRRLPLCLNPDAVAVTKGAVQQPGRWDFWSPTSELKMTELAARGFVSSGAICVALEIE
ncbi:hypothetical protein HPB49_000225 [Dermacentor silvarum]|uniref:Uncharacterized protein n=1 Tax=Dermacentor silvarum TaxID=543639 RepID=A0ACB8DLN8_DERSI|nr:uncharacterized protein LOC125940550 [Dermacentor silvarum]KAH7973370.1 hypothetical protein HPB49_000225 [Dermacentor silvarum]